MRPPSPVRRQGRAIDLVGIALGAAVLAGLALPDGPISLVISAFAGVVFMITEVFDRRARPHGGDRTMLPAWILVLTAVLAIVIAATPMSPGGVHPVWSYIGTGGGASIDREQNWAGLLKLLGLGFLFLVARSIGKRSGGVQSLLTVVAVGSVVLEVIASALAAILEQRPAAAQAQAVWLKIPLLADANLRGAIFGVITLLALERLNRALRQRRTDAGKAGKLIDRLVGAAPASITLGLSLGVLVLAAPPVAGVSTLVMAALFLGWTALSGGERQDVPRRIALWLVPALTILAGVVTLILSRNVPQSPAALLSDQAHWGAMQAAPWLGYGLGGIGELNDLIMTRANQGALALYPTPPNAYLAWLLQGGLLATIPLLLAIAWIAGVVLFGSLRPKRSTGLMRISTCVTLFMLLFALSSAGPALFAAEVLWAVILGLGASVAMDD